ncbi:DNA-binding domain of Mlu1-box binding protein MBP1 [Mucor ambiguus]|uniref:DNA-binding domain of Mlu1-box binding protein MBP1 n=1 Tax=Mucor ambiguus TaxID=91626 RepID=A0A0C9LUD4_9FUNG|nr:DNA-binding domain of Mlu1-box binding protein MBP1 [Mucor ambiguus]
MIENKKNLSDNDCLMYRPFQSENERNIYIKRDHYSTSLDPRGYIPVYEYIINGTPIMWDRETGYVHFTGIWKALGNSKSDIVKMVDSNPELGTKKIRGGFLRIQGTWIPYDYAHLLCKRTAWNIRKELVPIFGQRFALEALRPDHEDYGCLLLDPKSKSHAFKKASYHQKQQRNTTMRQKPYTKQQTSKRNSLRNTISKPLKAKNTTPFKQQQQQKKKLNSQIASSMSVTRLLNSQQAMSVEKGIRYHEEEMEEMEEEEDDDLLTLSDESSLSSFESTSVAAPFPTFRVIQTYPPEDWSNQCGNHSTTGSSGPLLPPICNLTEQQQQQQQQQKLPSIDTSSPNMMMMDSGSSASSISSSPSLVWSSSPMKSPVAPTHVAQDIIDTISATILLQRLSQDDGARPFKPLESSVIPSKVIVGRQEFTICWD